MNKRLIFWLAVLLLAGVFPAQAQGGLGFADVQHEYLFGQQARFSVRLTGETPPQRVLLFVQAQGESQARTFTLTPQGEGRYQTELDLHTASFPPFAEVQFWFGAETEKEVFFSQRYTFRYADNRYPWQTLAAEAVRLHWYAGDAAFGQAALDVALATVNRMRPLAPLPEGRQLDVYIYASYEDLASALGEGAAVWVGSHAYPGLSVALVAIAPGVDQRAQMETHIPHEVMHLLLAASVPEGAERLPAWLREGLASLAEVIPDPGYRQALQAAYEEDALLPLRDLCTAFPPDSRRAYLAYAEADAFVRYLRGQYGDETLRRLVRAYADGRSCEKGAEQILGLSLDELMRQWQAAEWGETVWLLVLRRLAPYLVLAGAILLTPLWQFFLVQEAVDET